MFSDGSGRKIKLRRISDCDARKDRFLAMNSRKRAGAIRWRRSASMLVLAGLGAALLPAAAGAQENTDTRLRRIESELRAVQRAVFPGADGRYFTPEVDTATPPPATPTPTGPTTSAVTDILARLDSVESQLARVTARSEELGYQLTQIEQRLAQMEAAGTQPAPTGVIPAPGEAFLPATGAANGQGRTPAPAPAPSPAPTSTPTPAPAASASRPSPERVAAVQAIAKPQTEDAGDDEYTYGYRLWEAGFYPEAQQQLALYVQRYPNHARISYGRNLLGRAYLDNGQPREAATYFFENFQSDRQAPRAPDSLLYLAEAMVAIDDTNRACIALAEFGDNYPALATGRLKEQYDRNRSRVTCT